MYFATAVLPYDNFDRATAWLKTELQRQLLAADVPEVSIRGTFDVTGPIEFTDLRGRTWYEYRATVECRLPLDRTTTVTRSGRIPTEPGWSGANRGPASVTVSPGRHVQCTHRADTDQPGTCTKDVCA